MSFLLLFLALLPLVSPIILPSSSSPLDYFLPPLASLCAINAQLSPPVPVPSPEACAEICLAAAAECISFNLCKANSADSSSAASAHAPSPYTCATNTFSNAYRPSPSPACSLFTKIRPRNDTKIKQAVPWIAHTPAPHTVSLRGQLLGATFQLHRDMYLAVRSPSDMLYWFFVRARRPPPPDAHCFGWYCSCSCLLCVRHDAWCRGGWIKGSETGNYLMGGGSYLQWAEDAQLRSNMQSVVDGIAALREANGWTMAFNESDIDSDNNPDYCASWLTRGLLDAHRAGISGAGELNRAAISLFNNHSRLAWFLPPNGGPQPSLPYPSGFDNVTDGGYGNGPGHMIYIQFQGMIKHSLTALEDDGTQADIDILESLYLEQWWLHALLNNDMYHAIWHRQFFSHNYEVTAFEAILDLYVLTGNRTYYQAVVNAWHMLREGWILPGGSFALNEGPYYPPHSYFIGFTGTAVGLAHEEEAERAGGGNDPYFHSKCMFHPGGGGSGSSYRSPLQQLRSAAERGRSRSFLPNADDPPTGELCGSVFWTFLNKRLHQLQPREEYAAEMERSIINVGISALGPPGSGGEGPNGTGIRYFANQHKQKQNPSMHASCCEGQGSRLFGSLPKFLYSLQGDDDDTRVVYVDVYAASLLTIQVRGQTATLEVDTAWPYAAEVNVTLTLASAAPSLLLALRMPAWLADSVPITVNGQVFPSTGVPGACPSTRMKRPPQRRPSLCAL